MEPAREELAAAIEATTFDSICPVYQNVTQQQFLPDEIKKNLITQLTVYKMDTICATNDCRWCYFVYRSRSWKSIG
jgi:hypothetical protein